jgi:predicted GNAT superfamily acetyltransferase
LAASFGFRGVHDQEEILHSHVTASKVSGLGLELKLHQQEWARNRGLGAITWTFDPLVRRNAVFNFEKLGAVAVEYLPNFYGPMTDSINLGDQSDRLFIRWSTNGKALRPKVTGDSVWVELPEDIESMRRENHPDALIWREKVRKSMLPLFEAGSIVRTMNPQRTAVLLERTEK